MSKSKIYKRQFDLVRPEELDFPIMIIGVGGIGSWATLALAKMGCSNITIVDPDFVEEHNVPSQFYSTKDIGKPKTSCLARQVAFQVPEIQITAENHRWQEALPLMMRPEEYVVISALDSMKERKALWKYLFIDHHMPQLYLDARMGGELFKLLTVPHDSIDAIDRYDKDMRKTTEIHKEKCTERAIVYNVFMGASIIASTIKRYVQKQPLNFEVIADIVNLSIERG